MKDSDGNKFDFEEKHIVKLNGEVVGEIRKVNFILYQYFPKDSNTGGEKYPSLQHCKMSLLS